MRRSWFKIFFIVSVLTVFLTGFQNCTSGSNQPVKFKNSFARHESGNGQPYEGKPDPGQYYRIVPGFKCQDGTPSIAGKINVTDTDMTLETTDPANCSPAVTGTLAFSQVEASTYNRVNLGHLDGIYQKEEAPPDPTVEASETWCRSVDGSFDVVVEQPYGAGLLATVRSATGLNQLATVERTQSGSRLTYSTAGLSLSMRLDSLLSGGDKVTGDFVGRFANGTVRGAVSCRTSMRAPLPMNFFVMTRDTTNAAFGGRAGANAFCLSQLDTYDFKGKVNATIDANHVFAFICDSTSCSNLRQNYTYSYALAGDITVGGSTFVTDNTGSGPGTLGNWNTAETFGANYIWWSGRPWNNSGTHWPLAPDPVDNFCSNWTSNSNSIVGAVGLTSPNNDARWSNGDNICSDLNRLICVVDSAPIN